MPFEGLIFFARAGRAKDGQQIDQTYQTNTNCSEVLISNNTNTILTIPKIPNNTNNTNIKHVGKQYKYQTSQKYQTIQTYQNNTNIKHIENVHKCLKHGQSLSNRDRNKDSWPV